MRLDLLAVPHFLDPKFWRYTRQRNTTAPVTDGGAAAASSAAAGSQSASQTGTGTSTGTEGSGGGTGTTGAAAAASSTGTSSGQSSADDLRDGDWRTLRTRYETAKQRASILDGLGVEDAKVAPMVRQYQQMYNGAQATAKALGYTDTADFDEAFAKDPIGLINLLNQEKAAADQQSRTQQRPSESDADYQTRIREEVERQTKPYTEHINRQISDAVTAKVQSEFNTHYEAALPNTPPEIKSLVEDYVTEYLASNEPALIQMKIKGDYGVVKDTVTAVAGRLKQAFAAWTASEQKRTGQRSFTGTTTEGQGAGTRRPTLDEMIEDPGLISEKYR